MPATAGQGNTVAMANGTRTLTRHATQPPAPPPPPSPRLPVDGSRRKRTAGWAMRPTRARTRVPWAPGTTRGATDWTTGPTTS
eukprot:6209941-Pleurochrysis_carterae.AAC.1